jgi:Inner membrane protein YgaP-like, transmembrane domain
MKVNMGGTDRVIRIAAGAVILALGMIFRSWWGLIGLVPLATGLVGFCALYAPFGISTCKGSPQQTTPGT